MAGIRWQFNNCLSEVGTPGAFTNTIYAGCCCIITCRITNVWNNKLTLTAINATWATGSFTATLNLINGLPAAFPYLLDPTEFVDIELTICAGSGNVPDTLTIQPVSAEHGAENHTFNFAQAPAPTITPASIDFGVVVFGDTSAPVNICITNNSTLCQTEFVVDASDCGSGIIPNTTTLNIDPGGINTDCFDIVYQPDVECEILNCNITITACDVVVGTIPVTGETTHIDGAPCSTCECLCCNEIQMETINTDANPIGVGSSFECDGVETFSFAAVGELKQISTSFDYVNGLTDGVEIYYSPWVFSNSCNYASLYTGGSINNAPSVAFYYQFSSLDSGPQPMALIGAATNVLNQLNWNAQFEYLGGNTFQIIFQFYMINDYDNWLTNLLHNNSPKWRRNNVNAVIPALNAVYSNTFPSVYNSIKRLCGLVYLIDPNTLIGTSPTKCWAIASLKYSARWYNKGLLNGPSEFIDPLFIFERLGIPVSNLSSIQKTEVKFYINIPAVYGVLDKIIFQLFDETNTDNTIDFLANYDSSRSEITTIPGISVLDNHLQSPSSITALGGDDYEITAFIDSGVQMGHQYRIMAIVYSDSPMVNTFISDPLSVINTPSIDCEDCQPDVSSTWKQYYLQTNIDCVAPVIKERLKHETEWNVDDLKFCMADWGITDDWLNYATTMKLNIYKRETDFPVAGKTTFFMVEQLQSSRVPGFPGNWNNTTGLIVSDTGSASDVLTEFTRRVGWEQTPFNSSDVYVANTPTYMNRTPAGALGSGYVTTLGVNNDWRQNTIYYEYILTLDFSSFFGAPFQINMVRAFYVETINTEPDNSGNPSIIESMEFEGFNGTSWNPITGVFCPTDFVSLRVKYKSNQPGEFIFFAEPTPGGNVATISESENQTSPTGLPQQLNVVSLDSSFNSIGGDYYAIAVLDVNSLSNGLYLLCGYWSASGF
jgi:hypothetical protein